MTEVERGGKGIQRQGLFIEEETHQVIGCDMEV